MSVLVKGMEMPRSCGECRFMGGDLLECMAAIKVDGALHYAEFYGCEPLNTRKEFCPLTEISEPHGETIDEAYARGEEDGYKKCLSENDFDTPCTECNDGFNQGYDKGLKDAWTAARKIACHPDNGGIPADMLKEVFASRYPVTIFAENTVQQAINKIKAWEENKNEIGVGDEVVDNNGNRWVVIKIYSPQGYMATYSGIDCKADTHSAMVGSIKKTGRRFEIEELLKAMEESDEN